MEGDSGRCQQWRVTATAAAVEGDCDRCQQFRVTATAASSYASPMDNIKISLSLEKMYIFINVCIYDLNGKY